MSNYIKDVCCKLAWVGGVWAAMLGTSVESIDNDDDDDDDYYDYDYYY